MRTTLGARVACRYAEQFAWSIGRGHFVAEQQSVLTSYCSETQTLSGVACSCDLPQCLTPGCHPVAEDWVGEASKDPDVLTRLWNGRAWWPIALTGLDFDAVLVDGPVSHTALSRLEHEGGRRGLVLTWRDDWHALLVPPGAIVGELQTGVSLRAAGGWIPLPAAALLSPARWVSTSDLTRSSFVLNDAEAVLAMLSSTSRQPGQESP
jgi:hypothetical protein